MLLYNFQKALYTAITSAMAAPPVYDYVPEGKGLPFIVIGDDSVEPMNTKTFDARTITSEIMVFSDSRGSNTLKTILDEIETAVCQDLSADGYTFRYHRLSDVNVSKQANAQNELLIVGTMNVIYQAWYV